MPSGHAPRRSTPLSIHSPQPHLNHCGAGWGGTHTPQEAWSASSGAALPAVAVVAAAWAVYNVARVTLGTADVKLQSRRDPPPDAFHGKVGAWPPSLPAPHAYGCRVLSDLTHVRRLGSPS